MEPTHSTHLFGVEVDQIGQLLPGVFGEVERVKLQLHVRDGSSPHMDVPANGATQGPNLHGKKNPQNQFLRCINTQQ